MEGHPVCTKRSGGRSGRKPRKAARLRSLTARGMCPLKLVHARSSSSVTVRCPHEAKGRRTRRREGSFARRCKRPQRTRSLGASGRQWRGACQIEEGPHSGIVKCCICTTPHDIEMAKRIWWLCARRDLWSFLGTQQGKGHSSCVFRHYVPLCSAPQSA